MILLEVGALVLGLAAIGLILLLDRPEDLGSVTPGWLQRDKAGRK